MSLKELLQKIIADPRLHGRFLNTFSYLEYIGFRKIVKSQQAQTLTFETISHSVEEGRHAMRLKKLALQTGGETLNSYQPDALLCGEEAESYFQTLDHSCEREFLHLPEAQRSLLTYLYVTWLVEVRALKFYGVYQEALQDAGHTANLSALLSEELGHLKHVEKQLQESDPEFRLRRLELQAIEDDLYQKYITALSLALKSRPEESHALTL